MEKVIFINDKKFGRYASSLTDKHVLLALFVGQYRFPDNIQEITDILKSVKNQETSWDEIIERYCGNWNIGYGDGSLDVEDDTAYFVSNTNDDESFAMPLEELISLMEEWRVFLS